MNYVLKPHVDFFGRGGFNRVEVQSRDITKIEVPADAYGFQLFDFACKEVLIDGEPVELKSQQLNVSPTYFYGGRVYTVDEIKRDFPDNAALITNVELCDSKKLIRCRTGAWREFGKTDILLQIPA